MGRKLMRVPLDFAWPLKMVWKGYVNPFRSQDCKACDCSGYNAETKKIADDFYDFAGTGRRWCDDVTQDEADALVAAGRLRKWSPDEGWQAVTRTAAEVNAANARGASGFGDMAHDAISRYILVETRAKRLGVYGHCTHCDGKGYIFATPEIEAQHEAWTHFEPPSGDGYQLWETTSEGSPISPVFDSIEKLCEYAAAHCSTFGSHRTSAAEWRRMLDADFVAHEEQVPDGPRLIFT
jgi:hypothetical protein